MYLSDMVLKYNSNTFILYCTIALLDLNKFDKLLYINKLIFINY